MIGRKKEKNILHDCLASNRPDFLALYESFMVPGNPFLKLDL
jgi:hypothetical protein